MKTYIINEFRRLKSIANKKDFVSFVQNSEWMVFNEDKDEIEKFIFVDKDNVLISFNGKSQYAKCANSTSKCKITKCFCKSTPLVLRNSISFLVRV